MLHVNFIFKLHKAFKYRHRYHVYSADIACKQDLNLLEAVRTAAASLCIVLDIDIRMVTTVIVRLLWQ